MELAKSSRGVIYMKETLVNSFFLEPLWVRKFRVRHPSNKQSDGLLCFTQACARPMLNNL
jgi:hypothetical protein